MGAKSITFAGVLVVAMSGCAYAAGDPARGGAAFQACAACHSIQAGAQLTGPSLANIWKRKSATVPGFARYSDALKRSNVIWGEETLDEWLADPDKYIPGTSMTFPGMSDRGAREDVIAYLKAISEGNAPSVAQRRGGMHGEPARQDLKRAPPEGQVTSITHCRDTYEVKTADGKVEKVWEFNLRFKTDSSELGPWQGKPVVVGAGMQGDRASVVFATPGEMGRFVKEACK